MAITYTWNVNTMDAAPSQDGLTDVVKIVHWNLNATDGTYRADIYSRITLNPPDPANFKSFDELTEAEVISWVESKLEVENLKADLAQQIEDQKVPPIVTLQGPWLNKS